MKNTFISPLKDIKQFRIIYHLICVLYFSIAFVSPSIAATFYVDGSMSNDNGNGTSWASAKKYINSGVSLMSGGDTLIIEDGIYNGNENRIYNVPSGNSSQYTVIQSKNDWGVTLTGQSRYSGACSIEGNQYVEVRGIHFRDSEYIKVYVLNSRYIKIIKCSSDDNSGNAAGFLASNSSYVLFEDCFKYGGSRYPFQVNAGGGSSSHIIFRRCVVRWDYTNTNQPLAAFANYDQSYIYYQNCIVIDGKDYTSYPDITYRGIKGFFTPNGGDNTHYEGSIVLNFEGPAWHMEDSPVTNVSLKNCIAWDIKEEDPTGTYAPAQVFRSRPGNGPLIIENSLFGNSDSGIGMRMDSDNDSIKNSIITQITLDSNNFAIYGSLSTHNYNNFYANTQNRNFSSGIGSESITINPSTNGLKYLVQIENGSILKASGEDGGQIGPTILKKVGVSGTLYGDTGWNTLTDDDLWPFPNEDVIRNEMRAWSKIPGEAYSGSPAMNGARGFCQAGQTLTKYIWEYLGNEMPGNIYEDKPVASINVDISNGIPPLTVNFTENSYDSNGYIVSYLWSFGDGETSTIQNPTHTYTSSGSYNATLTVTNEQGNTGLDSVNIVASSSDNEPPQVTIAADFLTGLSPLTIHFSSSASDSDGTISSYLWNFGDGETSTEQNPIHIYNREGNFIATLAVIDNDGSEGADSLDISVLMIDSVEVDYYIDSLIGSDGNNGTISQPWKSIQYAVDHVESGIIGLKDTGVPYLPFLLINKSNIVIKGISGKPEIRGTQYHDGKHVGVLIENASNIILDNLNLNGNETSGRDEDYEGIRMILGTNNITIKNCEIHHHGKRNIMQGSNVNYITLENNHIHHALNGHGVYLSNGGHDYIINGNMFEDNHSTGLQLNGDGRYMYNILIEKNIFSRNAEGLNHTGSDDPAETLSLNQIYDAVIKNNIFYNNFRKGVTVYSDSSPSYNVKIYNNTFYVEQDTGKPAIQVKETSTHDVAVKNNIIVNQEVENVNSSENFIVSGNEENIFINGIPSSQDDLQLKSGSIAIDQGMNLSGDGVLTDFDGKSRPQGNGYDYGAYEYVVHSSESEVPGIPINLNIIEQ